MAYVHCLACTAPGRKTSKTLHVDAAQGLGKRIADLQNSRIDLISVSGHKVYAPKGIGALIVGRRGFDRGLRPGTQPVALIVALGKAAELATRDHAKRAKRCQQIKEQAVAAFQQPRRDRAGDPAKSLPSPLNVAIPRLSREPAHPPTVFLHQLRPRGLALSLMSNGKS